MKKSIHPVLLYSMMMLFLFIHEVSFSQIKEFTGKTIDQPSSRNSQPFTGKLGKYLKKYSVYMLNINEISRYAKIHSSKAQFILNLSDDRYKLEIEPNELRGENFRAIAMTDKGPEELTQTFANTYKGIENGDRLNIVRLNISDSTFEGYIKRGTKWFYFDKLNNFIPNEGNDKIVVYDGEDVIPDPSKKCGAEMLAAEKKKFAQSTFALTGNCHFLEIATEADYEYYQAFSGNANAALSRIRNILNLVEGLYTSAYNVKFILRFQQIWTTTFDPYSGTTLEEVLPQFKSWWDINRASISRDETQIFSGRAVTNGHVGLAYLNVVCNTNWYYSSVVNYSPITNNTISLSAHELGHNFGAGHDATCNGNNIMCPYNQGGVPQWSSQSLTEISNYINSSGSCMTESIPADITYLGSGADLGYLKLIAANGIKINTGSGAVKLSAAGFGHIEAGSSIVLAPSGSASLGFLAPQGSVLLVRLSDVITTCDPLGVTASGTSVKYTDPLYSSLTKNRTLSSVDLSPNPFTAAFMLSIMATENGRGQLIIYNSLGIKVKEKAGITLLKGLNKITFNGSDLRGGVYMVEINTGSEKIVKKVVKL